MLFVLYNSLLWIVLAILSPFLFLKILIQEKYQKGIKERLGFIPLDKRNKINPSSNIWIHAVSVGEAVAVFPFYTELKARYPKTQIIFSTTTKTGQEWIQERIQKTDVAIYFPLDLLGSVRRVLRQIQPKCFISVETEIWPNFWWEARRRKITILLINGRLSDRSFKRYLNIKFFIQSILSLPSLISCQTEGDAKRYLSLGAPSDRVRVGGNLKFEILEKTNRILNESGELKKRLRIENDIILVGGSTHEGEEQILLDCYRDLVQSYSNLKLILAPRHPERFRYVEELIKKEGYHCRLESEMGDHPWETNEILLLDSMGKLSLYYSLATLVFIGKSLTAHGGQNLLEPAAFGKVIFFGPHMENFRWIVEQFLKEKAAIQVLDSRELNQKMKGYLKDSHMRSEVEMRAKEVVAKNRGAVDRNLKYIEAYL